METADTSLFESRLKDMDTKTLLRLWEEYNRSQEIEERTAVARELGKRLGED